MVGLSDRPMNNVIAGLSNNNIHRPLLVLPVPRGKTGVTFHVRFWVAEVWDAFL